MINMNKLSLFTILLICVISVYAINPPTKVITFYDGFKQLEQAADFNTANTIQQRMAGCFMASENSGINLDIDELGEMSSTLYTMKLHSMLYNEKSLKAICNIISTELAEQPDQNSRMQQKGAQHYITRVIKTYTQNGIKKTYVDIVSTLISNGLITEIINEKSIGNTSFIPKQINIEQLRSRAAYCYSKGMYTQAYDYYEQLVSRAPTDGDAAYRIALLTFWRKGCKNKFRSRKAAEKQAKVYIQNAIKYGNAEIREKATNVKKNWDNRNVYF